MTPGALPPLALTLPVVDEQLEKAGIRLAAMLKAILK
jgi:hypothetical protein